MKRHLAVAVGLGLVLAALAGALVYQRLEQRRHAEALAWTRLEAAVASIDAAQRNLALALTMVDDADHPEVRRHGLEGLDAALSALLRGVHGLRVASSALPGEAVPLRPVIEAATSLEDAIRVLAALGSQSQARQRESWVHRAQEAGAALAAALAPLRQARPAPGGPPLPWWVWLPISVVGALVAGWGARCPRAAPASRAPQPPTLGPEVVDLLPVPAVLVDGRGMVRWVNPAAATLLGVAAGSDPGYRWADLEVTEAASSLGSLLAREVRLRRSDGTEVWAVRMSAPVAWGQERFVVSLLWDITARRELETALREEAERWRGVVTDLECGVLLVDGAGVVVAANPAWGALMGLEGPVVGRRAAEVTPWPLVEGSGPWWQGQWAGRWLLGGAFPWSGDGDRGRVLLLVDAGAVRQEGSQQGRRAVLELCAVALERIQDAAQAVASRDAYLPLLIQTFRALVALRLGEVPRSAAPVDLRGLVRQAVDQARALGEGWGVAVHLALGRLPDTVLVDAGLLRQAMDQLLWGACLRARGSRVVVTVDGIAAAAGARVVVTVQAPGVPPGVPPNLDFPLGTDLLQGEALHLVVAELSVRALGAQGLVRRVVPKGTAVGFEVEAPAPAAPCEAASADGTQPEPQAEGDGAASGPSGAATACPERAAAHAAERADQQRDTASAAAGRPGLRVLVAEDNPFNAALLEGILLRLGARRVMVVADGDAFVAAATTEPEGFDLALVDVEMPGLDGLAAVRAVRAQGVSLPVVGVTAHTEAATLQACQEAGMAAVLAKPYDADRLAEVVRDLGLEVTGC